MLQYAGIEAPGGGKKTSAKHYSLGKIAFLMVLYIVWGGPSLLLLQEDKRQLLATFLAHCVSYSTLVDCYKNLCVRQENKQADTWVANIRRPLARLDFKALLLHKRGLDFSPNCKPASPGDWKSWILLYLLLSSRREPSDKGGRTSWGLPPPANLHSCNPI